MAEIGGKYFITCWKCKNIQIALTEQQLPKECPKCDGKWTEQMRNDYKEEQLHRVRESQIDLLNLLKIK